MGEDRTTAVTWRFGNRVAWRRGRYFLVRVLWFAVTRVPSWDAPMYKRWDLWFRHGGFTVRCGDWLLMVR